MMILDKIHEKFKLKYSWDPSLFAGMNLVVSKCRNKIFIHQRPYAQQVLEKFNMLDCRSVKTPVESTVSDEESGEVNVPYRELVGSLMFLAVVSRPDLSFVVWLFKPFFDLL